MKFIDVVPGYKPEVALEGIFTGADKSLSAMVSSISEFFPSLLTHLQGSVGFLEKLSDAPKGLFSSLMDGFSGSDYSKYQVSDYKRLRIRVPEGFTGNLYEYAGFLNRSWGFIQTDLIPQLDVVYGILAGFASNKTNKVSLMDHSPIYKKLDDHLKALVKESQIYYGKRVHSSGKSELGMCFNEMSEFQQTLQTAKNLGDQLNPKQTSQILDRVKRIAGVLDIIVKDARAREYDKASFEAVKSLATGVYTIAEAVEFYSITYYRVIELADVMKDNKATLAKI